MARFVCVLCLILPLILFQTSHAQWVQTSGPTGGAISVILADGTDLYAGTFQAGIFKSTDSGATWLQKIDGFGYQTVMAMVKCGPYILASGTEGLYRSSNGGSSWTLIPGFDALGGVPTLAVQGTHAIAGTSYGGVYVSSDTGATWSPSNAGLPFTVDDLSVGSSIAVGSSYFVCAGTYDTSGVYKSTDLGATWVPAETGLPPGVYVTGFHFDGSTLFAGADYVYKSTDLGTSWTMATSGISIYPQIRGFASNGTAVFAAGVYGVNMTTNGGGSWTPVTGGLPPGEVRGLATLGTDLVAGTITDGVYESTDGGTNWSQASAGIRARAMTGFTVDGSVLYGSGAGVFATSDDGDSWPEVRGDMNDSATSPALVYARGDTLFATEGDIYNSLTRSLDGGATWTRVWPELYNIGFVKHIVRTGSGYLTAAGSIYQSTDTGNSWTAVDSTATANSSLYGIERLNGSLFAFGTRLFRSTDDGSSWGEVTPTSLFFGQADMMTAVGADLFAGDKYNAMLWRSTDGGSTWGGVSPPEYCIRIDQLLGSGTTIFLTGDIGISRSNDAGGSWSGITGNLPSATVEYRVAVHNGYLFAGTDGNSVWRRPLSEVTSVEGPATGLPARATLAQNFPNPFNPSTTITWTTVSAGRVTIRVFDLLGREVAALFDGTSEPGEHTLRWAAAGLPGGVYYCRMTAGASVETKAMVLIR